MFPITCSSVGDIIAVAELIHKIVKALKDNKGAAQDYRDFVHGLEMMASVMEEVHRIARNSANGIIQDVVLDYARRCCVDLHRANELTSGFEILIRTQSSAVSNGVGVGDRLSRGARKLRWHFMKSSEAAEFTQRFRDYCSHIQLCVTLLNENTANFRAQQQQRRADLGVLTVREDIALLSASSSSRQGDIVRDLQALNTTSLSNTAVLAGRLYSMRETIARNSRLVSENLSVGRFTAVQRDIQIMTRKRFISIALPILVSWVALVIDSKLASSQVQLRQYTPWLALCTIVLHCLWMQAATIPRTVGYDEMNSIIFIDFIGDRMNLPLQICGTLDDFHDLIDSLFKRKKRKGWSFVLKQAFEIIESTSSNALTSWTWAEHVRVGAEIELAVVLRQISQGAPSIACPYCNAETLGGAADSAGDWLGCMGCGRSFQVSTAQQEDTRQKLIACAHCGTDTIEVTARHTGDGLVCWRCVPSPNTLEYPQRSDDPTPRASDTSSHPLSPNTPTVEPSKLRGPLNPSQPAAPEPQIDETENIHEFGRVHVYATMVSQKPPLWIDTHVSRVTSPSVYTLTPTPTHSPPLFSLSPSSPLPPPFPAPHPTPSHSPPISPMSPPSGAPSTWPQTPPTRTMSSQGGLTAAGRGRMIPQSKYRPYTPGDRDRYLNKIQLLEPVLFNTTNPGMIGIALSDALAGKYHQLDGRDDRLFHSSGPSISIRINWAECYPSWSRQIPTRDFKNPPGPVTRSKVARNVARSVQRFIDEMNTRALEEDSDIGWAVGRARNGIVLEDLALVRLEHVSKGSWEARLCFVHAGVNKGPLADRYI